MTKTTFVYKLLFGKSKEIFRTAFLILKKFWEVQKLWWKNP